MEPHDIATLSLHMCLDPAVAVQGEETGMYVCSLTPRRPPQLCCHLQYENTGGIVMCCVQLLTLE